MPSQLIKAALLSMTPISELRGGIPFAIASGVSPVLAFIICVIANIIIIPLIYIFLNTIHRYFSRNTYYKNTFNKYIEKNRHKIERHIGTRAEFWLIMLLTAIPLPMTGAYTATILSWFFGLKKRKSFLAVSLGVIIAGIIVTLISAGFFELIR